MWNVDCTVTTAVDSAVALVAIVGSGLVMTLGRSKWKPWYDSLNKAPWTPPDWLFGVVWTILYLCLLAAGITSRYYYEQPADTTPFAVNVAANVLYYLMWACLLLWSPIFFFARAIRLSLSLIIFIALVSIATDVLFWVIHLVPGLLMIPYLLWLIYATSLSVYIVVYNGQGSKLKVEEGGAEEQAGPAQGSDSDLVGSVGKKGNRGGRRL